MSRPRAKPAGVFGRSTLYTCEMLVSPPFQIPGEGSSNGKNVPHQVGRVVYFSYHKSLRLGPDGKESWLRKGPRAHHLERAAFRNDSSGPTPTHLHTKGRFRPRIFPCHDHLSSNDSVPCSHRGSIYDYERGETLPYFMGREKDAMKDGGIKRDRSEE